jgi:hypothetical protein
MELTFADLEVQKVELLPSRAALGGWGTGRFFDVDVANINSTNFAIALFGSSAVAATVNNQVVR